VTRKNVRRGFLGAGLALLSSEGVISKLGVKLRTPTPVPGIGKLPVPWASKRPNNLIEVISQSDFIKSRIYRHQGSSPTSILGGVDHLAKGTRGTMHQIALLKSEVHILRKENETLG
jgi:hypothetical protein